MKKRKIIALSGIGLVSLLGVLSIRNTALGDQTCHGSLGEKSKHCRGGKQMAEPNNESFLNIKYGEMVEGPINISDADSSVLGRAFTASPEEVVSLDGDSGYPDGTYVQNGNIHYPDGTVVENAFSEEETRIVLPDGSNLMPGMFHQITEDYIIDVQVADEP